ncbi:MAG: methyltransferase domain-containing protein [bacterium]
MVYIPTGRELIDPFRVLEESGIRSGMTVADFGCGTLGHYVFPAAQLVGPEGRVLAVDILKSVLEGIESRRKIEGATNVETVWGDIERENGVRIGDGSVDLGLLINNLFMSRQREAMVRECVRSLRPGGRLVVIDWKPAGVNFGPASEQRVMPAEARRLVEASGLQFEREFSPGKYHYGLIGLKP